MNVISHIFRNEILILYRNKFLAIPLLINLLCWGYIILSYETQSVHFEERAAAFYQGFIWMLLLNLLVVGLIAVYMAGKDRESEFEQIVATYQVKNVEWIAGKWLITQLYGLCITILTIFIQAAWLLNASMTFGDWLKNIFYVFIQMAGAFFLLISLGFLIGILIKNMFSYIFIPVILVLTLGLPFDNVGTSLPYDNPRLHLLTPFDYMFIQSPYEGIWGISRVFGSTIIHQSSVILLGLVVILVALLLFRPLRLIKKEKRIIPMLAAILIIPTILLSGFRYMQYDQALDQFIKTGNQYVEAFDGEDESSYYEWMNSFYAYHLDDQPYEFSLERTDLTVQLEAGNQISVRSNLTIKNNGDTPVKDVFLTLYHGLKVEECTSPSGVTCSRENDFITLHFDQMIDPEEEVELSLNYQGNILQYRDDAYVEQAFIENDRMYLPKEAGWYPLIGKRPLVIAREHNNRYVQFELRNGMLVEDFPTEFTVDITHENNKVPLALTIPETSKGMYHGTSQYGLSLVGGNLTEMMVDQIRVVGHPEVLNGAKKVVEKYQKGWSFIEDWLEVPMTPSVIYILNDWHNQHYSLTYYDPEFLVWSSGNLHYMDETEIAFELMNHLRNEYNTGENEDRRFLYYAMAWSIINHLHEEVSFKEWYLELWGVPDEEPKLINLLQSYEEKGIEEFNEVLKYLFNYMNQLEDGQEFDMEATLQLYEGESGE